jgi:hypothetical protein
MSNLNQYSVDKLTEILIKNVNSIKNLSEIVHNQNEALKEICSSLLLINQEIYKLYEIMERQDK